MGELAADLPPPPKVTGTKRLATTLGVVFRGMPCLLGFKKRRSATEAAAR